MSRKVYYHETRDELFNNVMEKSLFSSSKKQYCDIDTVSGCIFFSFITYFFAPSCVVLYGSLLGWVFKKSLSLSLLFFETRRDFLSLSLKEEVSRVTFVAEKK